MKQIIFKLLAFVLLLSGCKMSPKQNSFESEDSLDQAIKKAEISQITETDLFLGFKFGMTENEVNQHINELHQSKTIYTTSEGSYQYDFYDKNGMKYYFNFIPEYYGEKLYKMTYPITSSTVTTGKEYVFIRLAFGESERKSGFTSFIIKDALGDEIYTSIKSNLMITFKFTSQSVMVYENAPIVKIVTEEESKVKNEKAKGSYSNF